MIKTIFSYISAAATIGKRSKDEVHPLGLQINLSDNLAVDLSSSRIYSEIVSSDSSSNKIGYIISFITILNVRADRICFLPLEGYILIAPGCLSLE